MRAAIEGREAMESELRLALLRDEFELFYQPQIDLRGGTLVGAEALIRWHHPVRGILSPAEFMPVADTGPLSENVSAWILKAACRQAAAWQERGTPVRVGINLTQSQFTVGDLVDDVRRLLDQLALRPELVELEVTEDIILESSHAAQAILGSLRELGVKIAFDDFGTGYGSLTYLKAFPLDTIKIDQSFVRALSPGSDDAAIVRATIGLGHALGLKVIAEGIETEDVARMLALEGCDEGQGYLISRPLPVGAFEERFFGGSAEIAA
jgi:EAL domain-containing protein (putative c-di-GMP-specific phosphodiesterase class I)